MVIFNKVQNRIEFLFYLIFYHETFDKSLGTYMAIRRISHPIDAQYTRL